MINFLHKDYRVEDVIKLRNETPVGSVIRFKKKLTENGRSKVIFGCVVKKYEKGYLNFIEHKRRRL